MSKFLKNNVIIKQTFRDEINKSSLRQLFGRNYPAPSFRELFFLESLGRGERFEDLRLSEAEKHQSSFRNAVVSPLRDSGIGDVAQGCNGGSAAKRIDNFIGGGKCLHTPILSALKFKCNENFNALKPFSFKVA